MRVSSLFKNSITLVIFLMVGWGSTKFVLNDNWTQSKMTGPLDGNFQSPEMISVTIDVSGLTNSMVTKIEVAKYEVTFFEWQQCYEEGGCSYNPKMRGGQVENHPVTDINWFDANQYLGWVSGKTDQRFRLPTNEEWEYLAKDVIDLDPPILFDDPRMAWAAEYASYGTLPDRATKPVGSHGFNRLGISDLSGNVWEWTNSCWRNTGTALNPKCGGVRVLQGEHRSYQSEFIRTAQPGGCSTGYPPSNFGLRLVRDVVDYAGEDIDGQWWHRLPG